MRIFIRLTSNTWLVSAAVGVRLNYQLSVQ
jgi:hypothetical protein